jgi:thioesterase domain-containing protein/acyl carrier protein
VRADGVLEHLGRADRRVKVHGQLVDLGEVEQELERLPQVRRAVVSSVPTDDGKPRVVAHVALEESRATTVGELRRALADRLPPYAVPRAFFRVDDVPTASTGKVDRARLRESAIGALPLDTEYVAPRDDRERAVAALFAEVLAVDRVGVHDDFFELGGDSLSVVDLLAGLAEDLDLDLSPPELLDGATVEEVAARLTHGRAGRTGRASVVVPVNHRPGRPVFCVPGAGDTPLQYRALGRRLDDVALWAFTYHGMDSRALPDLSVAAIARRNIAALRAVDPTGPHRLLGFSFGGAVALEMARRLTAAGQPVELLVLLEPALAVGQPSRLVQSRAFAGRVHERAVSAHPGGRTSARVARAGELARATARYASRQAHLASAGLVRRRGLAQHDVFYELHTRLLRAYQPGPFHGRSAVFASPQFFDLHRDDLDGVLPPESPGGRRHDVPVAGDHMDLVREPNVAVVAQALGLLLASDLP